MPWGMEAGSMLEDFGKVAEAGSPLRRLYEGAKFLGLCAAEAGKISSGEFAETCLLLDIYAILSDDFGRTAKSVDKREQRGLTNIQKTAF